MPATSPTSNQSSKATGRDLSLARDQRRWHVARYDRWAIGETAVKLAAIVLAVASAVPFRAFGAPASNELSYWVLLTISVVYIGAIVDRLVDRELTALVFLALNLAAHWSMVNAMGAATWPGGTVRAFAALMLLGDVIKLGYFLRTGARVRNLPRIAPIALTGTLAVGYLVVTAAA